MFLELLVMENTLYSQVRVPAWTDRILFKIEDVEKINATLRSYESMDGIYSSDHKPVKAHLDLFKT